MFTNMCFDPLHNCFKENIFKTVLFTQAAQRIPKGLGRDALCDVMTNSQSALPTSSFCCKPELFPPLNEKV